jgi:hypothetical protein
MIVRLDAGIVVIDVITTICVHISVDGILNIVMTKFPMVRVRVRAQTLREHSGNGNLKVETESSVKFKFRIGHCPENDISFDTSIASAKI